MPSPPLRALLASLLAVITACSDPLAPEPAAAVQPPTLASLAPALTHMLFAMDLGEQVVGVSRYCSLPDGVERPVLGDALTVSTEAVLAAGPDVLLIQSDPTKYAPLQQLDPGLLVEHFSVETTADIVDTLRRLGRLAGHQERGELHSFALAEGLAELRAQAEGLERPRVLFVMGSEKPGSAGRGSFVHELIELAGGENVAGDLEGWPTLSLEYVLAAQPEVLICWTSPQDAERDRERWLSLEDLPAARDGRVHVVTETTWTLPTPMLLEHARQLRSWIHPSDG